MIIKTLRLTPAVLALAIFAGATLLHAQVVGGTITGEVRDASQAVVPEAAITIKNVATGVETIYKTSNEGVYFAPALIPGSYTITAEKEGFKKQVFGPVKLEVAQTLRADLSLTVGAVTQTVEVKASGAQLVQTETGEISQVIGSQAVAQLPLNGRDYQQLVLLNSGVTPGSPGETGGSGQFNVLGQRDKGNLFMVDGISTTPSVAGRGNAFSVPLDAVQEFSLQMNSYSAEYGDVIGGVLNVQIKGGTNNWHGSAFEFLRNDKLDASNFFSNKLNLPKNALRYNQFGGSIGGPIKRDKSFFFVDYEGVRTRSGTPLLTTVPNAANRQGDFSSGSAPIYDPTSDNAPPGFPFALRNQFSNNGVLNVIPPDKINPASAAMIAAFPVANQFDASGSSLPFNNFARNASSSSRSDSADARYDHNFSTKSMLFGRYSYRLGDAVDPTIFGDPLEGGGGSVHATSHNVAVGHTYSIRPNLINQFRFGLYHSYAATLQADYGKNTAQDWGMPNVNKDADTSGLPNMIISGITTMGDPIVTPLKATVTTWTLSDKLTWNFGRHTFRFGADYTREKADLALIILARGLYVFEPFMSGNILDLISGNPTGNALASFMTGFPTAILRDTPGHPLEGFPRYAMYFQDDFKVTSRLTLNLGVHYDLMPPSVEANDHQANFNPDTGAMVIPGSANPYGRRMKMTDHRNFAPRLGLAYALTSDRKTVLRSGYAIGFVDTQGAPGPANGAEFNPPFYFRNTISQFPFGVPAFSITTPFPDLGNPDPDHPTGDLRYLPVLDRNPYSQTWNLNIQRAITDTLFAEVGYVGSHGVRLLAPVNINAGSPGEGDPAERRPFGSQLGLIRAIQNAGQASYHGLQVKMEKKFAQGLWFLGSYTWSKSLDNQSVGTDNTSASGSEAQNANDLQAEWGRSAYDIPHRFVFSTVWEIPFGPGKRFGSNAAKPLGWFFGGWQFSGIYTAQSGTGITATMIYTDINADSNTNARPDQVKNPNIASNQRTIDKWFDTSAFVIPSTQRYGTAPRDNIQVPGVSNFDIGISKYFKWGHEAAKRFQFRAEMFNALNNTHLGIPNNSIDSPGFGSISSAGTARQIQFGLRFEF